MSVMLLPCTNEKMDELNIVATPLVQSWIIRGLEEAAKIAENMEGRVRGPITKEVAVQIRKRIDTLERQK